MGRRHSDSSQSSSSSDSESCLVPFQHPEPPPPVVVDDNPAPRLRSVLSHGRSMDQQGESSAHHVRFRGLSESEKEAKAAFERLKAAVDDKPPPVELEEKPAAEHPLASIAVGESAITPPISDISLISAEEEDAKTGSRVANFSISDMDSEGKLSSTGTGSAPIIPDAGEAEGVLGVAYQDSAAKLADEAIHAAYLKLLTGNEHPVEVVKELATTPEGRRHPLFLLSISAECPEAYFTPEEMAQLREVAARAHEEEEELRDGLSPLHALSTPCRLDTGQASPAPSVPEETFPKTSGPTSPASEPPRLSTVTEKEELEESTALEAPEEPAEWKGVVCAGREQREQHNAPLLPQDDAGLIDNAYRLESIMASQARKERNSSGESSGVTSPSTANGRQEWDQPRGDSLPHLHKLSHAGPATVNLPRDQPHLDHHAVSAENIQQLEHTDSPSNLIAALAELQEQTQPQGSPSPSEGSAADSMVIHAHHEGSVHENEQGAKAPGASPGSTAAAPRSIRTVPGGYSGSWRSASAEPQRTIPPPFPATEDGSLPIYSNPARAEWFLSAPRGWSPQMAYEETKGPIRWIDSESVASFEEHQQQSNGRAGKKKKKRTRFHSENPEESQDISPSGVKARLVRVIPSFKAMTLPNRRSKSNDATALKVRQRPEDRHTHYEEEPRPLSNGPQISTAPESVLTVQTEGLMESAAPSPPKSILKTSTVRSPESAPKPSRTSTSPRTSTLPRSPASPPASSPARPSFASTSALQYSSDNLDHSATEDEPVAPPRIVAQDQTEAKPPHPPTGWVGPTRIEPYPEEVTLTRGTRGKDVTPQASPAKVGGGSVEKVGRYAKRTAAPRSSQVWAAARQASGAMSPRGGKYAHSTSELYEKVGGSPAVGRRSARLVHRVEWLRSPRSSSLPSYSPAQPSPTL